jgi:hypothetical protein
MKMNKIYLAFAFCLICWPITCFTACISQPVALPSNQPVQTAQPDIKPEAFQFELGKMMISPTEAEVSKPVLVEIPVRNVGTEANAYSAALKVNDEAVDIQSITLMPGESGILKYTLTLGQAGIYVLSAGEAEGKLSVYYADKYEIVSNQISFPRYTWVNTSKGLTTADTLQFELAAQPHTSLEMFQPPVTPFYISLIYFRQPYPESFKILDADKNMLYGADLSVISNESATVPRVKVNGSFFIQMESIKPLVDIKPAVCYPGICSNAVAIIWPEVSLIEGAGRRFAP